MTFTPTPVAPGAGLGEADEARVAAHLRQARRYGRLRAAAQRRISVIAMVRLVGFALGLAFVFAGFYDDLLIIYGPLAGASFAVFGVAVWLHRRPYAAAPRLAALEQVHTDCAARLEGRWADVPDPGEDFIDPAQPHLGELQLFGRPSVFGLIGRVWLPAARRGLAARLTDGVPLKEIPALQEASAELAPMTALRHRLEAEARQLEGGGNQLEAFLNWAEQHQAPGWLAGLSRLPLLLVPVTWILMTLDLSFDIPTPWQPVMGLQSLIFVATTLKLGGWYAHLVADEQYRPFVALSRMFALVERRRFKAPVLKALQARLLATAKGEGVRPSVRIARLEGITGALSARQNAIMFIVFNVLVMQELWSAGRLARWQQAHGKHLRQALATLADFEVIAAVAGYAHERPEHAWPTVKAEGRPVFAAEGLGHPLIPSGVRRCNDFTMEQGGRLVLITGSNMSGKSSFLRTVGLNALMARAALPVCARGLEVVSSASSTSIQVTDAPELGLSLFYAEVKRIKAILDEVDGAEASAEALPRLYLIDEMLRGTNSKERNLATLAVARKLLDSGRSFGLITTHDLSLVALADEFPGRVQVYHFTDRVEGRALQFDYRLRDGVSTTTNALDLLRAEGIDV